MRDDGFANDYTTNDLMAALLMFQEATAEGFARVVDERFDRMDERFDRLERRVGRIETKYERPAP